MDTRNLDYMLDVMRAAACGRAIQVRPRLIRPEDAWVRFIPGEWNWYDYEYRINPVPTTELDEHIAIMQAFKDGKPIQVKDCNSGWRDVDNPSWDWVSAQYRLKPKPMEIWVNEYNPACGSRLGGAFETSQAAKEASGTSPGTFVRTHHFVEVQD